MAKRLTDTEKWKREWYCGLDLRAKLAWVYLLDMCDHRGVWFRNFKLMSDQLGFEVNHEILNDWFGSKILAFDGDKYFIESFVKFQYGELSETNRAHRAVISLMRIVPRIKQKKGLRSPMQGRKDKDKDKDKDKEEKGARKIISSPDQLVEELGKETMDILLATYSEDLIAQEFPAMVIWLLANPTKAKTRYGSFVSNWLKKAAKEASQAALNHQSNQKTMGLIE